MKRFLLFLIVLLLVPITACAEDFSQEDYESYLNSYDLSSFEETLDRDTYHALEELGIADFDYNSITSLSLDKIMNKIKELALGKLETPLKICGIVLAFVVLSSFFQSFKLSDNESFTEMYSTVSALVISTLIMVKMGDTVSLCVSSISVSADFIYAFIPAFCIIVCASGGITASFANNSLLLILAQGLSFLSSNLLTPLINCFLAVGICSSLRYEFHLDKLLSSIKKMITSCITFLAAGFISVLSIKTAVASRADALGLRSIRFAINSVVPLIGSAISEGLLSIQSYSSLISSSVGVVGIIAVALVFLPAIIEVLIWRLLLSVCALCADVFGDNTVSMVLSAFKDAMLLMNVILILSMVTTIISIGILIAASGG